MTVEWGKGCWVLQGSSTWNWNYHFRNKLRVLAPSCLGYKYPYSSCVGEGELRAWGGNGVTLERWG